MNMSIQKQMLLGMGTVLVYGAMVYNVSYSAIAGILYVCFITMYIIKKEDTIIKRIGGLLGILLAVGVLVAGGIFLHSVMFQGVIILNQILVGLMTYGSLGLVIGIIFLLLQEFTSMDVQKALLVLGMIYIGVMSTFMMTLSRMIPDTVFTSETFVLPWDLLGISLIIFVGGVVLECMVHGIRHHRKQKYDGIE